MKYNRASGLGGRWAGVSGPHRQADGVFVFHPFPVLCEAISSTFLVRQLLFPSSQNTCRLKQQPVRVVKAELSARSSLMWGCVSASYGCCDQVPETGRLQTKTLFCHNAGGQKSEIKVWAGLVPTRGSKRESDSGCASCLLGRPDIPGVPRLGDKSLQPLLRLHLALC